MRSLATIRRIDALNPIPNADAIEVADVLGWHVVVKRGEFAVGDLCVYCEVDSILPEREEFEFLRSRHFRIKTMKLRGQVSQGICFGLGILPNALVNEGDDVTELLGITKHEVQIPAHLYGKVKGNFPGFLDKTCEERIQNMPEILRHPDARKPVWVVTEKLDGTSSTFYFNEGAFGVCSRNLEIDLEDSGNLYVSTAQFYNLRNRLNDLGMNIALQGEIIGTGIQRNHYALGNTSVDRQFRIFTLFNINGHVRHGYDRFKDILNTLDLLSVPIIDDQFVLPETVDELVEYSNGKSLLNPNVIREGIVIRHRHDPEISFKVISPKYLLKTDN
jgi:RNA ligase (TIGR02306 family)